MLVLCPSRHVSHPVKLPSCEHGRPRLAQSLSKPHLSGNPGCGAACNGVPEAGGARRGEVEAWSMADIPLRALGGRVRWNGCLAGSDGRRRVPRYSVMLVVVAVAIIKITHCTTGLYSAGGVVLGTEFIPKLLKPWVR